jgi:hypothetical protein
MKTQFPDAARTYLEKARKGWAFLEQAIARHGRDGAYQKLTHYGDDFMHDDELAWAACELYLATGESAIPLIKRLAQRDVQLNITALLTPAQVRQVAAALNPGVASVVSVFGGRIADTGTDPMPIMRESRTLLREQPKSELLWASVREVYNIIQAEEVGCHIVTVQHDILAKAAKMLGQDLTELSLDTVKMFARDAAEAGYHL